MKGLRRGDGKREEQHKEEGKREKDRQYQTAYSFYILLYKLNSKLYLEALTTSLLVTGCVCERSCTLLRRLSMAVFRERGLGTPPSDVLSSS